MKLIILAIIMFIITVILIIINKQYNLEGYTFLPNLNFAQNKTPLVTFNTLQESTCMVDCDSSSKCVGFISDIPNNTNKLGTCSLYDNGLSTTDIQNMKYDVTRNLYIK
jgi:hypothetical protein